MPKPLLPRRLLLLTLALSACLSPLPALDPGLKLGEYSIEIFTAENGLPQSSVMALVQTRDGYLWLGTYEGLARYDGHEFVIYDKGNTPQMESNGVKALLEDRDGNLWVGTTAGLLRLGSAGFERFDQEHGLRSTSILCLLQDRAGSLWVGTAAGLHRWQGSRFRPVAASQGFSSDYIAALAEDGAGGLWVGTGLGLNHLRADGKVDVFHANGGLPHDDVRALYLDPQGTLWVGTSGGGLVTWKDGGFAPPAAALSSDDIRAIYRDSHGVMWIGTNQEPVNRLHGGEVSVLGQKLAGPTSGRAILEDREGSVWVGTRDGLIQLREDKFIRFSSRNGLPVDPMRAVFQDRQGAIWAGTVGGGLARYLQGEWQAFSRGQGLASEHVWSIAQGKDGALWVGTYGGGLFRLDDPSRPSRFVRVPGLDNDIIRSLLADSRGRIWAGSNGGGLFCIENGRVTTFTSSQGLPDPYVYSLAEDRRGRIWAGVFNGGLAVLENGRFRAFGGKDLSSQPVWAIHVDNEGDVWAGTDHAGLVWIRGETVQRFTSHDGLYSDQAFQILEDSRGRLWLNGNKGVYHVAKEDLIAFAAGRIRRIPCIAYGKSEGIRVTESSGPASPAGCIDHRGRVWFPTIRGLVRFDPDRQHINRVEPPVAIESVRINGQARPISAPALVPPGPGNIEIDYTAVSFLQVDKMRFAYRLEGFDSDWVQAGGRRSAFYTNLPPGSYTFRVIAGNGDDVWNREGASFSFTLKPFFTETALFRVLVILGLLLLVAGFFLLLLRRARARERKLERIVGERTAQLQHLARYDGLTDLANHRTFYETFHKEWAVAGREKKPLSLIAADIDHFKPYNDSLGHQQGDECLRKVASVLRAHAKRPADLAARTGGDEFFLLLPGTPGEGAEAIAEGIRAALADLAIPHPASPKAPVVTVSLGVVSIVPPPTTEANQFIAHADQALYRSKQGGGRKPHGG